MGVVMLDWWSTIGQTSLLTGFAFGSVWAMISTSRRRRKYTLAGRVPFGQAKWFILNFLSMGSFVALAAALGIASLEDLIPKPLFWFLLGLSWVAFVSALMFPSMETPLPASGRHGTQEPPADPPILPVRQLA